MAEQVVRIMVLMFALSVGTVFVAKTIQDSQREPMPLQFACPAEREFYTTCAEFQEIEKCRKNFSHLQLCR